MEKIVIAVANGDGIGPEIMATTLEILQACGAPLKIETVLMGEQVYKKGESSGIDPGAWEVLRGAKAFLKAPITTPQGGGFKSVNVTIRGMFGLYANIRPCVAYAPFIETKHPGMDLVIIRENEEDLYTGVEYRQSEDSYQALKIITRRGCERIVQCAFEFARTYGRKKVTCFTKDNILKLTDGLFHRIFEEVGSAYPEIEKEHWIVDIGAAKLADTPRAFDVIVLPNLYGDILSDVAAQIAGSVGLAGSANIGKFGAMFEAIHGSAPRRAGKNMANPSGLIAAAVQMLVYLGCRREAESIHNGWLKTIEEGIHTYDIYRAESSTRKVGTKEFGEAVMERLGQMPEYLTPVRYHTLHLKEAVSAPSALTKILIGADLFIDWKGGVDQLVQLYATHLPSYLKLEAIYNRGAQAWPQAAPEMNCSDVWRCRILQADMHIPVSSRQIFDFASLLAKGSYLDVVQIACLFQFADAPNC